MPVHAGENIKARAVDADVFPPRPASAARAATNQRLHYSHGLGCQVRRVDVGDEDHRDYGGRAVDDGDPWRR